MHRRTLRRTDLGRRTGLDDRAVEAASVPGVRDLPQADIDQRVPPAGLPSGPRCRGPHHVPDVSSVKKIVVTLTVKSWLGVTVSVTTILLLAGHVVKQVRHSVTLGDAGGVVEGYDVAGAHRAEEWATRSEHDRDDIHHDLVDQPEPQRLASDLPGGEV